VSVSPPPGGPGPANPNQEGIGGEPNDEPGS
jgi:hypothetical protein